MPDGTTTKQVLYRRATISLRDGSNQKCWRAFFPQQSFPGTPANERDRFRQFGTKMHPATPEKQAEVFKSAVACVDAFVTEYMKKSAAATA